MKKKKEKAKSISPKARVPTSQSIPKRSDTTEARLKRAEQLLFTNKEEKVIAELAPLLGEINALTPVQQMRLCRLCAFGYAHTGKLIDAEDYTERGLKTNPDSLDLHFVMTFIKLSMREYEISLEHANQFLAIRKNVKRDPSPISDLTQSNAHLSQLLNMVGSMYIDTAKPEKAEEFLRLAIEADKANHLPYLNLTAMLSRQKKHDASKSVITDGLKNCPRSQELQMLAENLNKRVTISACMIVKDEAELLADCLNSIREWVDEIIVVDTGSTDETVSISESFGAKVFHQEWEGNFSKHRNYSLEQATNEWVFIIDADERVVQDDVPKLVSLLQETQHSVISINVYNVYGKNEETVNFLPSIRLFRRKLNLRYEGIVHNMLQIPKSEIVLRADITIRHLGYDLSSEKMCKKALRSRALLEQQLKENPNNAFAHFNYAQLLRGEGEEYLESNAPRIIESASCAVQLTAKTLTEHRHIHLMALNQLAWTYFTLKDYSKSIDYCRRALALKPNYLDPLLLLGHAASHEARYAEASGHYLHYLEVQSSYQPALETDDIIVAQVDSRVNAYYGLAVIAELTGQPESAINYYQHTLRIVPDFLDANGRLGAILFSTGQIDQAEKLCLKQISYDNQAADSLIILGEINLSRQMYQQSHNYFERAVKAQPVNGDAYLSLGVVSLLLNRQEESEQFFKEAVSLGIHAKTIELKIAQQLFTSGRYLEAIKHYETLIALDPTGGNLTDLGNCYFKLSRYDQAQWFFEKALQTAPVVPATYRNLGLTLARLDKNEEAIVRFNQYLKLQYDDLTIQALVADLYCSLGHYQSAIKHLEYLLGRQPSDIHALLSLSDCYLNLGHPDSARMGYQRVLLLDCNCERARQRLQELATSVETA
ncbi:MAG: tetratricopeptide repeat protein [candidate division Zixibacteria bacterium]|nr:tetratricopeptide repeat protein [candidate division Zixibacteria bacterium]